MAQYDIILHTAQQAGYRAEFNSFASRRCCCIIKCIIFKLIIEIIITVKLFSGEC